MTESPVDEPVWFKDLVQKFDHLAQAFEQIQPFLILNAETVILAQTVNIVNNKTINVNITDSQIASLAVDAQLTVGRIDQRIGALKDDQSAKELSDVIARLTEEVTKSQEISSEMDRKDLLDGIELLLAQAERPSPARQRVVLRPIIGELASLCAGVGGLATVWQVAEPVIRAYFGL